MREWFIALATGVLLGMLIQAPLLDLFPAKPYADVTVPDSRQSMPPD